jgi:RND superfamily putative drug exporter
MLSTEKIAGASARRPWLVVGTWVVLLLAGGFLASGVGDVLTTEGDVSVTMEAERAEDLARYIRNQPQPLVEQVVVLSETETVAGAAYSLFVRNLAADLARLPNVDAVHTYLDGGEGRVSEDGRKTLITVTLTKSADGNLSRGSATAEDLAKPVLDYVRTQNAAAGFQVYTAGLGSISHAFTETSERDLRTAEVIGLPVALAVLVVVFGAAVAAGVPVILALMSVVIAVGATAVVGHAFELSIFVVNMVLLIGLAVGIDYSLLIVERFREERRNGLSKQRAIETAGATATRAVVFSGLTVIVALASMLLVPDSIFRSLAIGAILVTIVAIFAGLTLLPAVLSLLGDRVNLLRVPLIGRRRAEGGGFWTAVARAVMRRPLVAIALTLVLLLAAASPYLGIKLGQAGVSTLPQNVDAFRGFRIIEEDFSSGILEPVAITIDPRGASPAQVDAATASLLSRLEADEVFVTSGVERFQRGALHLINVPLVGDPQSNESRSAVERLRKDYIPAAFAATGAEVLVGGPTAGVTDYVGLIYRYMPQVFAFVLGLSFLLLLVVFRSVVVPAKALVMNLLSVGAAYGLLVLVFQHGFATGLLGFQKVDQIEAWVPLFLFAVLFGLSMDYHVFLLSRIRERFDLSRSNAESVAYGLRSTGGIITGAAAIMVAVFGGFAMGDLVMFQQMGFGLAVAVLLDATIVRSVLVPATMALLGDLNWYFPRWLRWLPDIRVEAASLVLGNAPRGAEVLAGDGE